MRSPIRLFTLCFTLHAGASLPAQTRVFTLPTLPPVAEVSVHWRTNNNPHVIELRNFSAAAEPILYLLNSSGTQVARALPNGTQSSMSVPSTVQGAVTLVVRSRSSAAVETGDIWVDGQALNSAVQFSMGSEIPMSGIASGETASAVIPPNGASQHVVYLLSSDGNDILAHSSGARTSLALPAGRNVLVVYGSRIPGVTGALRVYRNDAGQDTDGDGLGDALERALDTCGSATGSVAGAECKDIADPRDTDGDGLWDGWEVLGYTSVYKNAAGANVHEYLALPTWGSDPRHKDIFAEIDFRRLTLADSQNSVAEHMMPAVARKMAAIYGDSATTDGLLRAVHSVSMDNPDRRPGISIHLDTGVPPESLSDATIYGDWRGYNAVNAVPDGTGGYMPPTPAVWTSEMSLGRAGIFHYVLGYTSGGGSCGYGIACGFNFADAGNASHEFAHTLGLDHNGPYGTHEPNCKPNYPSLMNYAYLDTGLREFSDGRLFPTFDNHSLPETGAIDAASGPLLNALRSRWGYIVDSASGSVDWNRDGQFAPAGTTVRAYANLLPGDGGGCEFTREGEQQVNMLSARSPAVVRYQDHIWIFSATLDGKLAYTWSLPPFPCPKLDDCPSPAFGPTPGTMDVGGLDGVDAATIVVGGRRLILVVGIRPDGTMFETWVEDRNGIFVWGSMANIPGTSPAAGEPSLAVSRDGASVILSYKGRDNLVRYRSRSPSAFNAEQTVMFAGHPMVIHPNASPAMAFTGLPTGIVVGTETLLAAVTDTLGYVQLYSPGQFHGGWTKLGIPYGAMRSGVGRPALAWTGTPPASTTLASARTISTSGPPPRRSPGRHPPVRPPFPGTPPAAPPSSPPVVPPTNYGRLYVLYVQYAAPVTGATNPDPVRMEMSYVDPTGHLRIGLDSWFDNVWSYAFGVDLLQPGEVGLRAAESYSIPNAPSHPNSLNQVTFRPHADGMADLPYKNHDDWKVIGWGSCQTLRDVQPDTMKVACAPKSW